MRRRRPEVTARSALVGSIFPAGLVFEGGMYRTPEPSALIALFGGETAKSRNGSAGDGAAVLCGYPGWESNPHDLAANGF